MFLTIFIATIIAICVIVYLSERSKTRSLVAAPRGATRIEAIKAQAVPRTVSEYTRRGWSVVDQTTAKSFGSQARVTITFKKLA